ncbi:hypothetical protein LJY18_14105 [Pseudomonas sp. MMS21-TM103]|uniref:hypothetical protein n=1 Tax=Pseudomonas sp. MMS21 TM103 TaxID=2886506 RepID=UPI001EDD0E71|nr:hypothetical protein [Pseudomonas sp. MMS21 TM103]MCG4454426.1 hypothetical protein [Pseudomonas sp. MMS21 TM103]
MGDWRDACRSLVCRAESTDKTADMALNADRPDLVRADNFIGGQWPHRIEAASQYRLHCALQSRKTIDFRPGE